MRPCVGSPRTRLSGEAKRDGRSHGSERFFWPAIRAACTLHGCGDSVEGAAWPVGVGVPRRAVNHASLLASRSFPVIHEGWVVAACEVVLAMSSPKVRVVLCIAREAASELELMKLGIQLQRDLMHRRAVSRVHSVHQLIQ